MAPPRFLLAGLCLVLSAHGPAFAAEPAAPELAPRTVTLQGKVRLSRALAELVKQTGQEGVQVLDRRGTADDPELALDLPKATFWQALDAVAKAADARVSLYQRGQLALVKGPWRPLPVSYHGLFRVVLKRLAAERNLETGAHFLRATLEVAWEPRFRPLLIAPQPRALAAEAGEGKPLQAEGGGGGMVAPESPLAMEVDVRLPAPPREVKQLGLLRGQFALVGPTKMLTFDLGPFAALREGAEQVKEDVRLQVTKVVRDDQRWTVQLALAYPPGGPTFESYQSWVANNEIYLEREKDGRRFPNNGGFSEDLMTEKRAVVSYHFVDDRERGLARGEAGDWRLVYRAPARFVELAVPFEFRGVPLP